MRAGSILLSILTTGWQAAISFGDFLGSKLGGLDNWDEPLEIAVFDGEERSLVFYQDYSYTLQAPRCSLI